MEKTSYTLVDDAAKKRYEFNLGDDYAFIEYIKAPGYIILTHTEVPPKYEGQGIAAALTLAVLEKLRAEKAKILPQCTYVTRYIQRHPEWADLVITEIPKQ